MKLPAAFSTACGITLFDTGKNERLSKLNSAVDDIRKRFGEDSVKRACFIETSTKNKGSAGSMPKNKDSLSHFLKL